MENLSLFHISILYDQAVQGSALDRIAWLAAAGWLLLAAVVLDGIGAVRIVRNARGLSADYREPDSIRRDRGPLHDERP